MPHGKNRYITKNEIKAEYWSQEYNRNDFVKTSENIPLYIIEALIKHPQYQLLAIEVKKDNPYIYCECSRCKQEIKVKYSKFIESQGHGCVANISSGEAIVAKYLSEHGIIYKEQRNTLCCINPKTKRAMPYDFEIPHKKIIIEVQGEQHTTYTEYFHGTLENFEYQKWKDHYKKEYAIKNGYTFIEIFYDEINNGTYIRKLSELIL